MKLHKKYQPLFYQKEMNAYFCKEQQNYRIYEVKEEEVLKNILPYQENWGFTITFGYQYPLLIFPHDCKYWYIFKEIEKFDTSIRFQICLSFLEKIIFQQMDDLSIYFFCDSTNLWFDQKYTVHFFYMPKLIRLQKEIDHNYLLSIVAKFIFRHIHLQDIIVESKRHLYNQEYLDFYEHVNTEKYYTSILEIYDELYLLGDSVNQIDNSKANDKILGKKIEKVVISIIVGGIIIFYTCYGIVMLKNYMERQYHNLYSIGNQTLYEDGDIID